MNPAQELMESLRSDPGFIKSLGSELLKADSFLGGTASNALVTYNLNPTVHLFYPYLQYVPLMMGDAKKGIPAIAHVDSKGGTAAHWKTVTAVDPNSIAGGVGRGQRAGVGQFTTDDRNSPFYGMGYETAVDFETVYEGGQRGDLALTPRAMEIAAIGGMQGLTLRMEKMVIGGNSSLALGTTPTPTVTDGAATGGTITQGGSTLSVICVALTNDGRLQSGVSTGVVAQVSRGNAGGSTTNYRGGSAQKSASGTLSLTASHTALATVTPVSGAVAYAWFWGAVGAEKLGAITTIAGIELKADATGTQLASALPASDNSKNGTIPDGLITQMTGSSFGVASGSYVNYLSNGTGAGAAAGTVGSGNGLTPDSAGGIVEFDAVFQDRWTNYGIGFDQGLILINAQEAANLTKKILTSAAGVTSLFRSAAQYGPDGIKGGYRLVSYHNKFTNEDVDIEVHRWVPPGTVIFYSTRTPYQSPDSVNLLEFEDRQGFHQISWPLTDRQYPMGFYWDGALKNHFTAAFGMLSNLGNN